MNVVNCSKCSTITHCLRRNGMSGSARNELDRFGYISTRHIRIHVRHKYALNKSFSKHPTSLKWCESLCKLFIFYIQ